MGIGVALPGSPAAFAEAHNGIDLLLERAHQAAAAGIDSVWFPQRFDFDAITVATLVGREVPGIEVGTAVVPMYPRHPLAVAIQAQTAQAASRGRFTLGIGLAAGPMVERMFDIRYERPLRHLRDYIGVLRSVFDTGTVNVHGPTLTADFTGTPVSAHLPGARPAVPILVAAMGPQALRVAGELADGTVPLFAGPKTLANYLVPTIREAARSAGRPQPRIVAEVPTVVTAHPAAAREAARQTLALFGNVPSYRAVLDREGAAHPADVALIGDEDEVAEGVQRYFDAGATDVVLTRSELRSAEDVHRTWQLAGELARQRHG
ncbi:TIGR03564 family F420-dependent LLM class oxidoreductase [Frankia sp. QA3]|uniref:TIGR03564 family F420-dependent LLM class oxidoreductase n=1 Tax=Frankia sp. QA3 TaxID=710111 RepID=UPI000269BFD9|nr:TIGR03564 family F420-dependent LLM class oxidoreductase [Frankia sp. QA3]EIV92449.1 F420-dependent oxidoreductase, MSMEG_4879 family [Frankia sp. QA3]